MAPLSTFSVLMLCYLSVHGYTPSLYYMDEECNFDVSFPKDVRMKLTYLPSTHLDYNWRCTTTFKTTTPGDRILVRYRNLGTDWSTNCRKNMLRILDSDKQTALNGQYGNCGGMPLVNTFTTSGNSVTFKFQTDSSFQYGQFDILMTSFSTGFNNSCPDGRFHCRNNRCVSQSLVCNGYNDCADSSDENCPLAVGIVAGIVVGSFVFIALCITLSVLGRARRRRYRRLCEAKPYDTCHTTTTASYPQPGPTVQHPYPQPSYQAYGR